MVIYHGFTFSRVRQDGSVFSKYPINFARVLKPIICFDKSGGEPEFVEDDCGFIVPYLDLDAMSNRIIQLYQSPDLRQKLGENAKQKVCDRHDISVAAP
jgi:glycosyltransferase involved in cell wall biosynthesis